MPPWTLENGTLYPTRAFIDSLCTFLSSRQGDDTAVTFSSGAHSTEILSSRLEFAGGPLRALCVRSFRERETRTVHLAEDPFAVFLMLRDALYGKKVVLGEKSLDDVLQLIRMAHRWQTMGLFEATMMYVRVEDCVKSGMDVLKCVEVVELPEVDVGFLKYFWQKVGVLFDEFGRKKEDMVSFEGATDDAELPVEVRLNALFPQLWSLALSHDMVEYALHCILRHNDVAHQLLQVVLQHLEPQIESDDLVCRLISRLDLDHSHMLILLTAGTNDSKYSPRAMRLLAQAILSTTRDELRHKWRINLHKPIDFFRESLFAPEASRECAACSVGRKRRGRCDNVCCAALRIATSLEYDDGGVYVSVECMGGILDFDEVGVELNILDDACVCAAGGGGALVSLEGRGEFFEDVLQDDVLQEYRKRHGVECCVTVSLTVRFIPRKV